MTLSNINLNIYNLDQCFINSQGCNAGQFDDYDCWAEYITCKNGVGAFAAIMNARYGLGDAGTDGPSQRYQREFWDAVFSPLENKPEIGRAMYDSKEDNIYRINESGMRWCHYEITLFGDPCIPIINTPQPCNVWGTDDDDGDGLCSSFDNCPDVYNPDQSDVDFDRIGDVCDPCPIDPLNDADSDGYCAEVDNCPSTYNPGQEDADNDSVGDVCDICPGFDDMADNDEDGWPDSCDICPDDFDPFQDDHDNDGIGSWCDNCPITPNPDQEDSDGDGVGDLCDICPGYDDNVHSDVDAVPDGCDNCPLINNANQSDIDDDGWGDVCDNCPDDYNPDQIDANNDGIGDICYHCCMGEIRGNIDFDNDDLINIVDLTFMIEFMFRQGQTPECLEEANVDGSPEKSINIVDLT